MHFKYLRAIAQWLIHWLIQCLKYAWAFPNSVLATPLILICLWHGRVRRHSGVLEITGPAVGALLLRLPNRVAALTLGHVVLGTNDHCLDATRAHERVHVRQYEILGPLFLPAYLLASMWAHARGGDAYRDNWFEKQAYDACRPRRGHGA